MLRRMLLWQRGKAAEQLELGARHRLLRLEARPQRGEATGQLEPETAHRTRWRPRSKVIYVPYWLV